MAGIWTGELLDTDRYCNGPFYSDAAFQHSFGGIKHIHGIHECNDSHLVRIYLILEPDKFDTFIQQYGNNCNSIDW